MDATRDMKIALETKGHVGLDPQMFKPGDIPLSSEGFFRMDMTDDKTDDQETFFILPPKYARACLFPFYRATSRCLAYPYEENVKNRKDRQGPTIRFLKDSWQEDSQRTAREAVIMRLGSDVPGLETETQEWSEGLFPKSKRLKCKIACHRLVLNIVARDLSTFTWCKVLLSCIADAVEGAQQAYKASILHHDLSASNIMIVKDKDTKQWRGVLIDWDMCLLWRRHRGEPRSGRTGTWAFISAQILQNQGPTITHTLWDDIESAFWVFIYEALLYLKHDKHPLLLSKRMHFLFSDNTFIGPGLVVDGREKVNVLTQCLHDQSDWGLTQFEKLGVNELLDRLGKVFVQRYLKNSNPSVNLDDPDQTWFSDCLREAATKMQPLCITTMGLKSPTNDSNLPDDPEAWESVMLTDSNVDYFRMPLGGDPDKSTNVERTDASSEPDNE
ncbi:hypothetical protein BYT27DRAFT_7183548 [Phlegmacium glaucopus]|nr:hypothetical protein BYT27DRAFT_7183548 [Phlegmacium glaucopus]